MVPKSAQPCRAEGRREQAHRDGTELINVRRAQSVCQAEAGLREGRLEELTQTLSFLGDVQVKSVRTPQGLAMKLDIQSICVVN